MLRFRTAWISANKNRWRLIECLAKSSDVFEWHAAGAQRTSCGRPEIIRRVRQGFESNPFACGELLRCGAEREQSCDGDNFGARHLEIFKSAAHG